MPLTTPRRLAAFSAWTERALSMHRPLVFATRPSALARRQTDLVIDLLRNPRPGFEARIVVITTQGDRILDRPLPEIGGKGLFTLELEEALLTGAVDAAVHSLKDLPTEESPGLILGAVPPREDARDVWVCPAGFGLDDAPAGTVVGTSSLRRAAQLLARRPDLDIRPVRGNVDTRLRKTREGQYGALVLAAAGLARLGLQDHITETLPFEVMLPAPGQGALAVQSRADDDRTLALLAAIEDPAARRTTAAERAFLRALGGGCSLPVGAHAVQDGERISLTAAVLSPGGERRIALSGQGDDPEALGAALAAEALAQGAAELFEGVR
ncbi:MAG TPA: hydroxymethylbilane synthase [Anaerolineales bacterium]|nr:hydroxymethylbilane synthase [Anaerolineales bacterium]